MPHRHGPALNQRLVIVMVGLPARGKTFTARKLSRYLAWRGYQTKVFNVGNYRRDPVGAAVPAAFFDPTNEVGAASRQQIALEALNDMLKWVRESGQVAIYDATNSTKMRRKRIRNRTRKRRTPGRCLLPWGRDQLLGRGCDRAGLQALLQSILFQREPLFDLLGKCEKRGEPQ